MISAVSRALNTQHRHRHIVHAYNRNDVISEPAVLLSLLPLTQKPMSNVYLIMSDW
jgi:hypothetical protein